MIIIFTRLKRKKKYLKSKPLQMMDYDSFSLMTELLEKPLIYLVLVGTLEFAPPKMVPQVSNHFYGVTFYHTHS